MFTRTMAALGCACLITTGVIAAPIVNPSWNTGNNNGPGTACRALAAGDGFLQQDSTARLITFALASGFKSNPASVPSAASRLSDEQGFAQLDVAPLSVDQFFLPQSTTAPATNPPIFQDKSAVTLQHRVVNPAESAATQSRGPYAYLPVEDGANIAVVNLHQPASSPTLWSPPGGLALTSEVAVSPNGAFVYLSSSTAIMIMRAHDQTVLATLPVGAISHLTLSQDGSRLYVAMAEEKKIAVIDTHQRQISATYLLDFAPQRLAVSPDGTRLYVLSNSALYVLNSADGLLLATHDFNGASLQPRDLVVTGNGNRVYLALAGISSVAAPLTRLAYLDTLAGNVTLVDFSGAGTPLALRLATDDNKLLVLTRPAVNDGCLPLRNNLYVLETVHFTTLAHLQTPPGVQRHLFYVDSLLFVGDSSQGRVTALAATSDNSPPVSATIPSGQFIGPLLAATVAPLATHVALPVTADAVVQHPITYTNTGALPVNLGTVRLSMSSLAATRLRAADNSGFVIAHDTCSGRLLQPSESCIVTIDYTPTAQTTSATLTLSADADQPIAPVTLTATKSANTRSSNAEDSSGGAGAVNGCTFVFLALWAYALTTARARPRRRQEALG